MVLGCCKHNTKQHVVTDLINYREHDIILRPKGITTNIHGYVVKIRTLTTTLENLKHSNKKLLVIQDVKIELNLLIKEELLNYHNKRSNSKKNIDFMTTLYCM